MLRCLFTDALLDARRDAAAQGLGAGTTLEGHVPDTDTAVAAVQNQPWRLALTTAHVFVNEES